MTRAASVDVKIASLPETLFSSTLVRTKALSEDWFPVDQTSGIKTAVFVDVSSVTEASYCSTFSVHCLLVSGTLISGTETTASESVSLDSISGFKVC